MNSFDEARHEFWVGTMTPPVRASEELLADADLGGFLVSDYIAWKLTHPGCTRSHGVRPHWFMWQATYITATGHRIMVPLLAHDYTFLGAVYEAERVRRDRLPHGWLEGVTGAPEYRGPRAVFIDVPPGRENLDVLADTVRRFWRDTVVTWWRHTRAARALHLLARGWDPEEGDDDRDD